MTARRIVAAATTLLVVGGCGWLGDSVTPEPAEFLTPTTVAGRPDAPVVLLVGDSISQFSHDQLALTFTARGWTNAVVAHSGTRTVDNRGRIAGAVQQHPDVLVVELGTNDALWSDAPLEVHTPEDRAGRLDESIAQIEAAVRDTAPVPCVVWVDVNDWTETDLLRLATTGAAINDALERLDAATGRLHLARYRDAFAPTTPEATAFLDRNFDPERLHPVSDAARNRYATLVADTVQLECDPR